MEESKKDAGENNTQVQNMDASSAEKPSMVVNAQYIKDLSFENPHNPIALKKIAHQPKLDVTLDIKVHDLETDRFEVILYIAAKTTADEKVIFLAELAYAALVTIKNMTPQNLETSLFVYVPSLLFPFARRVLADVTREGSLPPLNLDPIDFGAFYLQKKKAAIAQASAAN